MVAAAARLPRADADGMTIAAAQLTWAEANQRYLVAAFAGLAARLRARERGGARAEPADGGGPTGQDCAECAREMERPPAIDQLAEALGLSPFERELVLLAAGVEMDAALAQACSPLTFGLALALLAQPHWSALTPERPLRRYRLIELERGAGLTACALRLDERILHHLAGVGQIDARLRHLVCEVALPEIISEEHAAVVGRALAALGAEASGSGSGSGSGSMIKLPALHWCGDDPSGHEDAAALVAAQAGCRLFLLRAEDLPASGPELEALAALWEREARLLPAALLIQIPGEPSAPVRLLAERLSGLVMLSAPDALALRRPLARIALSKPSVAEQRRLWRLALGEPAAANGAVGRALDQVSDQFRLSARAICATARGLAAEGALAAEPARAAARLWEACRSQGRPRLEHLAQRLAPAAGWEALVLPEPQLAALRQLTAQVRHRMTVHERWGFAAQGKRGLGVSALFCGESGTGKTLAAEVLARELALDLYRIDLSAVVSKYIGETEKNLRQVFDAAEDGGTLLLFDEADALFGKRGEVKDSHDRYANIEVGYLLQRMEAYQGLAILTTNLKSALDRSFQRRLRFIVHFSFPDAQQRALIWARIFPAGTPTRGLDALKLSQLKVAGGSIRSIALNAAFLAASAGAPVGMEHLLAAAQLEAQKLERPLAETEIRGWA
jgi:hypothetical protein